MSALASALACPCSPTALSPGAVFFSSILLRSLILGKIETQASSKALDIVVNSRFSHRAETRPRVVSWRPTFSYLFNFLSLHSLPRKDRPGAMKKTNQISGSLKLAASALGGSPVHWP